MIGGVMPPNPANDKRKGDPNRLMAVLWLALAVLFAFSLALGSVSFGAEGWQKAVFSGGSLERIILIDIRLPRSLLAPLIGAAFGLSGAALQGFLRNPLAEPSVLGAPQMAALGTAGAIFLFGIPTTSPLLAAISIGFALTSVVIVAIVAGGRASTSTLLIAGLAIASLASALLSLVLALSDNPFALAEVVFWLIGSLEDRSWHHVMIAVPPIALGCALLLPLKRALAALVLGEETASSLGINLPRLRWQVASGVALAIGGAVAVAGAIGFVGLLAPHLVRRFVGNDPGRALFPAALAGAVLVLAADCVARLIPSPTEIKVGMVTALIGVPVFLAILIHHRARFSEGM